MRAHSRYGGGGGGGFGGLGGGGFGGLGGGIGNSCALEEIFGGSKPRKRIVNADCFN